MITYSGLPFDVVHHLCSMIWATDDKGLFALSLVDRRTRSACIPLLFAEIIIDPQWENGPWDRLVANVEALLANECIMNAVRSLHFQPWVRDPGTFPIPSQFFDLLFALPSLSELGIFLQSEYLTQVQREFKCLDKALPRVDAKFLPKLQSLTIPYPEWMFISECCPNLTSLDVRHSIRSRWPVQGLEIDIVRLGKSHPNLKSLHCKEIGLSKHINEIAENLPYIQELGLHGEFARYQGGSLSVMDHLKAYNMLKHLRHLSLPGASDLGIGFFPSRYSHAYRTSPIVAEVVEHEHENVIRRLMDGISSEVITRQGSTLCDVIVGERFGEQEFWERGHDGRLFASKSIQRSRRTQKIITMTMLEKRPLTFWSCFEGQWSGS